MSKNSCMYGPRCESCIFNLIPRDVPVPDAQGAAIAVHNAFRDPDLPDRDAAVEELVEFAKAHLTQGYSGDKTRFTGALVAGLVLDQAGICDQR